MTVQMVTPEPARTPEVDEVLRRIGRNLLLFQHIEHLLKHLVSNARFEGTVASAQVSHEERRARIHKQTLGQVAGQFADDVLADAGDRDTPKNIDKAWLSFGITIQTDSAFLEQHTAEMKAVVDTRNDLIHHFLPQWSPSSEESTRAALAYLDEQRSRVLPMRDRLQGFAKSFRDAAQAHAELIASPEGARQFELQWLRHSRLVLLLGELATRTTRTDGWMALATAGQVIKLVEPEELEHMAERYGHRTLKKLLQATELFDIEEEPTAKGGTQTIYRINPHFEPQIQREPVALSEGNAGEPSSA
jgi:OST-HTH/LOTUS domain